MHVITELSQLPDERIKRPIVTWGVFDGVHVGHTKVIRQVIQQARLDAVTPVVITFDRHPAEVLQGRPVPLITSLKERLHLIGDLGIEFCVVIPFTLEFSRTTPEEFLRDIIRGKLDASGVILGHDSMFGKDREGNFETLQRIAPTLGLRASRAEVENFKGRPVSSSLIRELVLQGRIDEANALLGREFMISGKVVKGDERGKTLGFPTANVSFDPVEIRPPSGVYAARCLLDGAEYPAVVNIGVRPTFGGGTGGREWIEAHLLDYAGADFYGRFLEVRFLHRLRDEKPFKSPAALKKQIEKDIRAARERAVSHAGRA
jgi:riboflavin kinase/FMN adenylyltransferase